VEGVIEKVAGLFPAATWSKIVLTYP